MSKLVRWMIPVLLIIILLFGFFQWKAYVRKLSLRSDALLYFKEEDYTKSIRYLKKALLVHALFAREVNQDIRCYLAESYYKMGKYEQAERLYHKLQKSDPNNALYYLLEGQSLKSTGDYEAAMAVFSKGYKKTKSSAFLSGICEIYIEQNEYKKAEDYARKGIGQGGSGEKELMYDLIIIYEKSRDYEKAYEAAIAYCDKYPEDENARKELLFLSSRI